MITIVISAVSLLNIILIFYLLDCLKVAKNVILEASTNLFLPNYSKSIQDKQVDIKDGNTGDLVTKTDKNIQEFIHKRLSENFPTFKFMGEENDEENVKLKIV